MFSISIAIFMLFLYKLPFKFLLNCLNLIYLYPVIGTILIIITIMIKRFSYGQDIQLKHFFFPVLTYQFFSVLLHIMGIYMESEDVAIIFTGLKDKLCLIIMGYVSVKEIVWDIFIKLCPNMTVLYMNDPNRSSSIGRNSPVENRPLIAVKPENPPKKLIRFDRTLTLFRHLDSNEKYRDKLVNLWIREKVSIHSSLYEKIIDAHLFGVNSNKEFKVVPWGTDLWEKEGQDPCEYVESSIEKVNDISKRRADGELVDPYPILCMNTEAFIKLYKMRYPRGVFTDNTLPRRELKMFKEDYTSMSSIRVNLFLSDVDNYKGSHQPMASYIASKLNHTNIFERRGSAIPSDFGNLERAYTFEMYKKYQDENPLLRENKGGISSYTFNVWLKRQD